MSYTVTYRINNHDLADPVRKVQVEASPEQIQHLADEGYLVRERLITGDFLEELRAAVDELVEAAGGVKAVHHGRFGGLFIRNLMDKHPTFLKLLHYQPLLSVARAALGPQVQVHGTVIRVTYPGQPNQETHWHFHQRVMPQPVPPLFARSRVIDNLIYLDDLDDATGPFCVVPRTHLRVHDEVAAGDYSDKPGQVILRVPAGSCVTADAGLWHRGMPTRPDGKVRRLIIWGYSPTWMKQVDVPGGGLTDAVLQSADLETRELLGRAGHY
jgi:ectoine hydroxylase-related dioxygenase (phytanoyl-CoA dioxygenase family)